MLQKDLSMLQQVRILLKTYFCLKFINNFLKLVKNEFLMLFKSIIYFNYGNKAKLTLVNFYVDCNDSYLFMSFFFFFFRITLVIMDSCSRNYKQIMQNLFAEVQHEKQKSNLLQQQLLEEQNVNGIIYST